MIKFSIIVVCLNAGRDLPETIQNILAQSYNNFEIVVKDGGSTDGSIDSLPADTRIRFIQKSDTGIYDAMNQGIEAADSDFSIFINAGDCFYDHDVLKNLAAAIKNREADVYYGHTFFADNTLPDSNDEQINDASSTPATGKRVGSIASVPKKITNFFCYRSMICHQSILYKTSLLKERGYDTKYKICGDRELLLYHYFSKKVKFSYEEVIISVFQGGGLCDSEKGRATMKVENRMIMKTYISAPERFLYESLYQMTLPGLRKKLVYPNPERAEKYRKFMQKFYKTKY